MGFEEYIDLIEDTLCSLGNVQTKAINYGVQIVLTGAGKKVTLNIYNGKKGINLVWGGGDSDLQEEARSLVDKIRLFGKTELEQKSGNSEKQSYSVKKNTVGLRFSSSQPRILLAQEPEFSGVWMGSDESGKGDYFGPLVVASVCLDTAAGEMLIKAGVRDCKAMSDERVTALAKTIEATALAFSVLVMKPHAYNMRYEQVQRTGGSLNALLALGHIAALKQTWSKYPACKWAVVDQFVRNEAIPDGIHAFAPNMKVMQRTGAEEDIAVAAASVLARAAFLQTIQQMGFEAGIGRIPKGGGEAATNAARRLVQQKGTEALGQYVKLHFANTQKL
ncbi:MAG TPA: hypothetical protein DCS50_00580 [Acidaminococcaceae bacterium]|nr:hypothetical protein [Acidaminococcaceae bacterium]